MPSALEKLADLIWPRICPVQTCGRLCDRPGRHICSNCLAKLPWYDRAADGQHAAALWYLDPVDTLIQDFKFRRAFHLLPDLTDWLEAAVRAQLANESFDVIVPVPIHLLRHFTRGYNQSAFLAKGLAKRLGVRYDGRSLVRTVSTPHQARGLGGEERRKNLKYTCRCRRPEKIRGKTVLVVDDVMTTGATLNECVRALEKAGARRVLMASLARVHADFE